MNKPLRIGLIGAGWVSRPHAEGWLRLKERAHVVAVADVNRVAAQDVANLLGAQVFGDYRELLENVGLDAVDICVPPHLHVEIVRAAAARGIHVLCEKPLACDMAEADRIGECLRETGITYMPAHNSLFHPTTRRAREYLDNGDLGDIYYVRTSEHFLDDPPRRWGPKPHAAPEPDSIGTWRASKSLLKGGALMDGGFHPIYRLLYLAGSDPVAVTAMMTRLRKGVQWESWEAEDTAIVLVLFSNGSLGEALITYAFDSPRPDADRLFSIAGSEGLLMGNEHTLYMKPAAWSEAASQRLSVLQDELAWRESIAAEVEHFAGALIHGRGTIQTFQHARTALQVVRAAYESVERGLTVKL